MNDKGHITLARKMLNWGWYTDVNTFKLFIHVLLMANWKDGEFLGVKIKRGSFATSLDKLAKDTGLSKQCVRTALKHLNLTQEVTQQSHGKFTVITVKNYDTYQVPNTITNTQLTSEQHTTNTQLTPIEESNKVKRKEDINTSATETIASLILKDGTMYDITRVGYEKYVEAYPSVDVMQQIKIMALWCENNPTKRKTRRCAPSFITGWLNREQKSISDLKIKEESKGTAKKSKFDNFSGRDYDMSELERSLIK